MKSITFALTVAAIAAAGLIVSAPECRAYEPKYSRTQTVINDAERYMRRAQTARNDAERYDREAVSHERNAEYYARQHKYDRAEDYRRRAERSRRQAREYMHKARQADCEAADCLRRAAHIIESR